MDHSEPLFFNLKILNVYKITFVVYSCIGIIMVKNYQISTLIISSKIKKCITIITRNRNNLHARLKPVSKCAAKLPSKPWITKGIGKSIKIKNPLFYRGNSEKYKYYRRNKY